MDKDIFNYYFTLQNDQVVLHGDVCIQKMRQNEFIDEKKKYVENKVIARRDKLFKDDHPNSFRYLLYSQLKPNYCMYQNQT